MPGTQAASVMMTACPAARRRICRGVAPTARISASSRRWEAIDTDSAPPTMKATTSRVTPASDPARAGSREPAAAVPGDSMSPRAAPVVTVSPSFRTAARTAAATASASPARARTAIRSARPGAADSATESGKYTPPAPVPAVFTTAETVYSAVRPHALTVTSPPGRTPAAAAVRPSRATSRAPRGAEPSICGAASRAAEDQPCPLVPGSPAGTAPPRPPAGTRARSGSEIGRSSPGWYV